MSTDGERQAAQAAIVEHDTVRAQLARRRHEAAHVVGLRAARQPGQHQEHGPLLAAVQLRPVQCHLPAVRQPQHLTV